MLYRFITVACTGLLAQPSLFALEHWHGLNFSTTNYKSKHSQCAFSLDKLGLLAALIIPGNKAV